MVNIFTDGGARGNPGPAAIGVFIADENNNVCHEIGEKIGVATNNVAEYKAVIYAFNWLLENQDRIGDARINFFMDSELVASQLKGIYRVKNEGLLVLFLEIKKLEKKIGKTVAYTYIPREKNKKADSLVNLALDNKLRLP